MKGKKLERVLNKKDVLVLSFGAMIGWGWVVQAGDWILSAGSLGAVLGFVIGGIMISFVGLTYAELTAAMPESGGEHVFSKRAMGNTASFICTWALILGYTSVVMFQAVALPTVLQYIFPNFAQGYMYTIAGFDVNLTWVLVGILGASVITIINYFGVKLAAFVQTVLVTLMALVGIALVSGSAVGGNIERLQPVFSDGFGGVLQVLALTPFFYVGFDVIPQAAGEINIPFRKVGKIMLFSIFLAIAWHVLVILAVSHVIARPEMADAGLVTAEAIKIAFGDSQLAANVLILGGLAGIVTSWNSFFVGGSRAIFAMAESEMLPSFFTKLDKKYNTPVNAIWFIGLVSCIAPFFGERSLLWIANAGGFSVVIAYFTVSLSFLILRKKEPNMPRPYKVRRGTFVGVMALIMSGVVGLLYLIPSVPSSLTGAEWGIVGVWALLGVVMYMVSGMSNFSLAKTKELWHFGE